MLFCTHDGISGENLTPHDTILKTLAAIYAQEESFINFRSSPSASGCDVTSKHNYIIISRSELYVVILIHFRLFYATIVC